MWRISAAIGGRFSGGNRFQTVHEPARRPCFPIFPGLKVTDQEAGDTVSGSLGGGERTSTWRRANFILIGQLIENHPSAVGSTPPCSATCSTRGGTAPVARLTSGRMYDCGQTPASGLPGL